MDRDARLEEISDKIRKGEPVGMFEALEAIDYQEALRAERKRNTLWARFVRWLSAQPRRSGDRRPKGTMKTTNRE